MSSSKSLIEKTKEILNEQFSATVVIAREAATSGGWWYPFQGMVYFIAHPSLYRAIAPILLKCTLTALAVTAGLFIFAYLPQVAFCALFSGPFAVITAAVMVLGEAYALTLIVAKAFFLGQAQDQIFDAVLLQQGHEHLVSRGREVKSKGGYKKLGNSLVKPLNRFSKEGIIRYVVSLPLNSIPGIGTILFFLYNGIKAGPGFHARYFQLKGFDAANRQSFVEDRRGAYTAFGAAALALNVVPVVGLVFGFTSTVGAALWASQLERKGISAGGNGGVRPLQRLPEDEVLVEL
ncbi:Outer spore wall protein RRT8 [Hypsizygus marmoreus]|uniref:Outer spore wall protein RRT8 n=1 Tax=Hypsizygus marmoreus TaxID=39966 RepID=A0A369JLX1_HYPMA|nr:Outer spore wall protein RRT8 [Hypsizygus marmoreus]